MKNNLREEIEYHKEMWAAEYTEDEHIREIERFVQSQLRESLTRVMLKGQMVYEMDDYGKIEAKPLELPPEMEGYNQAVSDLNKKIDTELERLEGGKNKKTNEEETLH